MLTGDPTAVSRARAGVTFMEMLVVLAVVGLLAGVLAPEVLRRLTTGRHAALASTLASVSDALLAYRTDVGRYPRQLRLLTSQPTTSDRDSCNRTLPATLVSGWAGPYLDRQITTSGIVAGSSTVLNTVRRAPTSYSTTGTLLVDVTAVDEELATLLEQQFDGTVNFGSGTIRWTESGGTGQGTLVYAIPIRNC